MKSTESEEKIVAIGDIHGCAKSLRALLEQLKPHDDRHFVFVGDYIDRGPDSKGAVDTVIDFKADHSCTVLRGNHEQMLIDAFDNGEMALWLQNGGSETLRSYDESGTKTELPYQHHHFYRNTKLYHETEDYLFVHAGVDPEATIREAVDNHYTEQFLWERSHLKQEDNNFEKTIVFGHTPRHKPIIGKNMIGIDTGCVYDKLGMGILTAVLLPEMQFVTQKCIDETKHF